MTPYKQVIGNSGKEKLPPEEPGSVWENRTGQKTRYGSKP